MIKFETIINFFDMENSAIANSSIICLFVLKNLILRYILTGEMPTDFSINYNTHLGMSNKVHYNASIPQQEKPEI